MIGFANAKINIGLHILRRLENGYHEIETVFYPLYGLQDVVEIVRSESLDIVNTGLQVDVKIEDNLVIKAYNLLQKDFNLPKVMFYLHKNIPLGAGLGGGSANAVTVLQLLNKEFDLNLPLHLLQLYAKRLGADCSFFLYNNPMIARGLGEKLSEIKLDLEGYNIVVVKPDFSINTAKAYSLSIPKEKNVSLEELVCLPVEKWKQHIINDFEQVLFPLYPELKDIKKVLYDLGALYVSLSGSGSAIYGIFDRAINLEKLSAKYSFVWQSKVS